MTLLEIDVFTCLYVIANYLEVVHEQKDALDLADEDFLTYLE